MIVVLLGILWFYIMKIMKYYLLIFFFGYLLVNVEIGNLLLFKIFRMIC